MKTVPFLLLLLGLPEMGWAQDSIPPTIICKQTPLEVNLMPHGMISLLPESYMYDTVFDNVSTNLEFGLRKICMGKGFPVADTFLTFYYADEYDVEVWVRDEAGNTATCITTVRVTDIHACVWPPLFTITLKTEAGDGVKHANVEFVGRHCKFDTCRSTSGYDGYNNPGQYRILNCWPMAGGSFSLYPQRNDAPLNGVTTYDLVLISKHILGIEPLDSPYKLIAADANLDGKITTADVVLLRKLILGIIPKFPHEKSWRFVKKNHFFFDTQNPQHPPFPESIWVPFVDDPPWFFSTFNFIGVKIGDVNGSAVPGD